MGLHVVHVGLKTPFCRKYLVSHIGMVTDWHVDRHRFKSNMQVYATKFFFIFSIISNIRNLFSWLMLFVYF